MFPVFDGHNDILLRLYNAPEKREQIWLTGEGKGHLDLPRMKQGGFAGGFFAIYIPSPHDDDGIDYQQLMENPPFLLPLPALISASEALPVAWSMANQFLWMERASAGAFKLVKSVAEIRANIAAGVISRHPAHGRGRGHRPRPRRAACLPRHGPTLHRPSLVTAHGLWSWRALRLPIDP